MVSGARLPASTLVGGTQGRGKQDSIRGKCRPMALPGQAGADPGGGRRPCRIATCSIVARGPGFQTGYACRWDGGLSALAPPAWSSSSCASFSSCWAVRINPSRSPSAVTEPASRRARAAISRFSCASAEYDIGGFLSTPCTEDSSVQSALEVPGRLQYLAFLRTIRRTRWRRRAAEHHRLRPAHSRHLGGGGPATGRQKAVEGNLVSDKTFETEHAFRPQTTDSRPPCQEFNWLLHLFLAPPVGAEATSQPSPGCAPSVLRSGRPPRPWHGRALKSKGRRSTPWKRCHGG